MHLNSSGFFLYADKINKNDNNFSAHKLIESYKEE